ncbi:MAG: hypothetical protein WBL25_11765 [Anaerolineales bacterium]
MNTFSSSVLKAYGRPHNLSDEEILERLLALNWSGRGRTENLTGDERK